MAEMNRRTFLKLAGGGAAAFGIGADMVPGLLTQAGVEAAQKTADDEWEFYYPGKYDASDKKVFDEVWAKLDRVNKSGDIDIEDVISGKLNSENTPAVSWNPYESNYEVTYENMMTHAATYAGNNPLFADREYAKKTKYKDLIAFPLVLTLEVMPAMPKSQGIGDYMVVSAHNDVISFYKPFHEGDRLFTVYDEQHCTDITPEQGSRYRTFAMSGRGKTYNQKGELVAEGANILKESFRRHKDPSKRNADGAHLWESPDWWTDRKAHLYTDEDWDAIIAMWKNERQRGAEPLYWDDVNIGDEPVPTAHGPILTDETTDMLYGFSQWVVDLKKNILDPNTFKKMVKNKQGIYVLPEYLEKKTGTAAKSGELSNRDGRATIQNAVCGKCAAGMLFNWMGDAGWLQRIGWNIMELPVGYDESVIPPIPMELRPALFDKYPYMDKVPYLRGCRAAWHALEGDLIISRAYVTDKYEDGGEYFVDLTWWTQTIDNFLVEEGFATVKLPKK